MFRRSTTALRAAGLALGAAFVLCPGGLADLTHAAWIDANNFNVKLSELPDLDQFRSSEGSFALPGNGGAHCVPTSAINLMAYIANHGFPQVGPGPGNWQLQSKYFEAGLAILTMGQFMDTDPVDGTGGADGLDGLKSWLNGHPEFTATTYSAASNYAPQLSEMAQVLINGGLVNLCYGRYDEIGTFGSIPIIQRDGGHCVTLSRATASGEQYVCWVRDPASGGDGGTQSAFENRSLNLNQQFVTTAASIGGLKNMLAVDYNPLSSKNAYIDRYYAVRPKAGYSLIDSEDEPPAFWILLGALFEGYGGPDAKTFEWTLTPTVLDLVLGPDETELYVLTTAVGAAQTTIHSLALADGSVKPVASVPGVEKLFFGRDRSLYGLRPDRLYRIDLNQEPATFYSQNLPAAADALTFDDATDEIVVLSTSAGKLLRYPFHLDVAAPDEFDVPSSIASGITPSVAVDPTDGRIWLANPAAGRIHALTYDEDGGPPTVASIGVPGMTAPTSVDVDDHGRLFVADQGVVRELEFDGASWQDAPNSLWTGRPAGEQFRITRSRTNHDPFLHSGPGWRNLLPDEVASLTPGLPIPDCDGEAIAEEYGQGKPGGDGVVPHLAAADLPVLGMPTGLVLSDAEARRAALPAAGHAVAVPAVRRRHAPGRAHADLAVPLRRARGRQLAARDDPPAGRRGLRPRGVRAGRVPRVRRQRLLPDGADERRSARRRILTAVRPVRTGSVLAQVTLDDRDSEGRALRAGMVGPELPHEPTLGEPSKMPSGVRFLETPGELRSVQPGLLWERALRAKRRSARSWPSVR